MPPTKPQDFPLLLEVFREGLACGLISKNEIVAWADEIIKNEEEPDYFFIELSLSPDTNQVAEVLNQYISGSKSPIPIRVIFGLIYQKLTADVISLDMAITFTEKIPHYDLLTSYEYGSIYVFQDYEMFYLGNDQGLKEIVVEFLSYYKDFNLSNYAEWTSINAEIEEVVNTEQAKLDISNEERKKKSQKQQRKRKLKRYAIFGILSLILLFVVILNLKIMLEEPTLSKLFDDHQYLFGLDFFVLYLTLRTGYKIWAMRRKMR